jgi:hypothetical protein
MIEDDELRLKMADNSEEAYWIKLKDEVVKRIDSMRKEIIINEAILVLALEKIKINEEKEYGK